MQPTRTQPPCNMYATEISLPSSAPRETRTGRDKKAGIQQHPLTHPPTDPPQLNSPFSPTGGEESETARASDRHVPPIQARSGRPVLGVGERSHATRKHPQPVSLGNHEPRCGELLPATVSVDLNTNSQDSESKKNEKKKTDKKAVVESNRIRCGGDGWNSVVSRRVWLLDRIEFGRVIYQVSILIGLHSCIGLT